MKGRLFIPILGLFLSLGFTSQVAAGAPEGRPNVLWIVIEDASCHISCYGETAIQTPNIDALAGDGVRFENAFTTSAVCSPVRSALITGMYQTTSGALNHRSQVINGKGSGNTTYYDSYRLPAEIPLASKLFEAAGYYTTNENLSGRKGKTDYNFVAEDIYQGISWKDRPDGTPFFTQIQLKGGKNRGRTAETENFRLPPYYYEDAVMRGDWKQYLGSWLDTDQDVRQIVADLKAAGVYDNTLIFLVSDHGVSHLRGKQFLYDEGIKVPLIVKFPGNRGMGSVRADLVKHIDILPSSLAAAGIPIPEVLQGKDLFSENYEPQEYIVSARDRCDETTEIIRALRTRKYKYIRNFLSYRPHAQRNQYKDGKGISGHSRELFEEGRLNELQARFYRAPRPAEELYDLENDPFETENLSGNPEYTGVLSGLRKELYSWMDETNDPVLIPEPYLEELGKQYGNKFTAMKQEGMDQLRSRLIHIVESGERKHSKVLLEALESEEAPERYWAVTWLGVNRDLSASNRVEELLRDKDPSVRIAANLALFRIDPSFDPIPNLAGELNHSNLIVGMYAMSAIEQSGIRNKLVLETAEAAAQSPYEFTRRYGNYLVQESAPKKLPNIVFILVDDLGYGDIGCFGQTRIQTPNIDQLAAEGIRFTRAYAGSAVCAPCRSSLMEGKHPGHARVRGNTYRSYRESLRKDDYTVAMMLREAGYKTGLFGKWGLGLHNQYGIPNNMGFDEFFGYLNQRHAHCHYPEFLYHNRERVYYPENGTHHRAENYRGEQRYDESGICYPLGIKDPSKASYAFDVYCEKSLEFVRDNRNNPFFLYLAYTPPHGSFIVPDLGPYAEKEWSLSHKVYAAMITRVDTEIGRLMKQLKKLGIEKNTLVIFASDNGNTNGNARQGEIPTNVFFNNESPRAGKKGDILEGAFHVPSIARWPGKIAPGQVSDHMWAMWDFFPTAAEITGQSPPEGLDGISILPTLLGERQRQQKHDFLYWEFKEEQAVRMDNWYGFKNREGRLEIYNLEDDPDQATDLSEDFPDIAQNIEKIMQAEHIPSDVWPSPGESEEEFEQRMAKLGITEKDRPNNVADF